MAKERDEQEVFKINGDIEGDLIVPEGTVKVVIVPDTTVELSRIALPASVQSFSFYPTRSMSYNLSDLHLPDGLTHLFVTHRINSFAGLVLPINLQTLDFSFSLIEILDGTELDLSQHLGLEELNLRCVGFNSMQNIQMPPNLRVLNISHNHSDPDELSDFLRSLPEGLEVLVAKNITLKGLDIFSDTSVLPNLQKLIVEEAEINSESLACLEHIENLRVFDCSGAPGVRSLDQARFPVCLQELRFDDCGISSLERVQWPEEGLRVLSFDNNTINTLEGFACPRSLTSLSLKNNQITTLTGVKLCESIESLNLSGNQIASLDGFVCPRSLTHLDISGNDDLVIDLSKIPSSVKVVLSEGEAVYGEMNVGYEGGPRAVDVSNGLAAEDDGDYSLPSVPHVHGLTTSGGWIHGGPSSGVAPSTYVTTMGGHYSDSDTE